MTERPYPDGTDWVWLACDREGHLGLFATGGQGPVPAQTLNPDYPEDVEQRVDALPVMSDVRRLPVAFPWPDIDLAERGFFVYNWSDVHRVAAAEIDAYELIAAPYRPRMLDQLPADLSAAARLVRFTAVSFADSWRVDVRAHTICREAGQR